MRTWGWALEFTIQAIIAKLALMPYALIFIEMRSHSFNNSK